MQVSDLLASNSLPMDVIDKMQQISGAANPKEAALSFAKSLIAEYAIQDFEIKDTYATDDNLTHVYIKQMLNSLEILDGDMSITVAARPNMQDEIIAAGNSFFRGSQDDVYGVAADFTLSPVEALEKFVQFISQRMLDIDPSQFKPLSSNIKDEAVIIDSTFVHTLMTSATIQVPFALNPVVAKRAYIQAEKGTKLKQVWQLEVELNDNWFSAVVTNDQFGEVVMMNDWVSDSSYLVYPLGVNDPHDGDAAVRTSDLNKNASPLGWHLQQKSDEPNTQTIGNNVYAQENWKGSSNWKYNHRPDGGKGLSFHFENDLKSSPKNSVNASVTNLFYWNNILHDIFYGVGFTEVAGNFQQNNFGKGGKENDAVIAHAQDGSGKNNANFATPPDGRPGRMRMYEWTRTNPYRDGDFENGIIIHEYAHGVSNRLTGGPGNSNCLPGGEAGGMGEGWGDAFATMFRQRSEYNRSLNFPMGEYSNTKGIRNFPYSTSIKVNPETYSYITKRSHGGVHAKGAVWAEMLYEVYWNMVDITPFDKDWINGKGGNNHLLHILIQGMKLQPCRPNFLSARNAILTAEAEYYDQKYYCAIWKGFAKRGLGFNAKPGGIEDFSLPERCKDS